MTSLGTRPLKNRKEALVNCWGESVHCARYAGALPIGFWLAFWCAFFGNANHTRTVFAFCFVLESCKCQAGKIEHLYRCLVQQKTLQALQGLAINKFLTFHSVTLPPCPVYQTLLSDFSRVWLWDHLMALTMPTHLFDFIDCHTHSEYRSLPCSL